MVSPVCPPKVKKITKFLRVFEGSDFCTYVCTHDKPVAANKAVISCKMATFHQFVSLLQDFTSLSDGTPIIQKFEPVDFDCITDGKVVPLAFVEELIMNKDIMDLESLREAARGKSFALDKEVGRNDVMKQII